MSVFRSNKYRYVQVISDECGRTVVAGSPLKDPGPGITVEKANTLGSRVAERCKQAGIGRVVFDRNGYQYHGRIQALVVTNSDTKEKSGNGSEITYPKASIVDPELMLNIPCNVTAATGLDVLFHAVESFVAKKSNAISDMYALEAIKLVKNYLPAAYADGENLQARENMALASMMAGYSIDASTVVLCHSIAHAISGITNTAHGLAIASISEEWLEHTYPFAKDKINEVLSIFGADLSKIPGMKSGSHVRHWLILKQALE